LCGWKLTTKQDLSKIVPIDEAEKNPFTGSIYSASDQNLRLRLLGELELLKQVHGEPEGQRVIRNMFAWMEEIPSEDVTAAVVAVLNTGEDAFAFGRFSPDKDGFLKSYPTFRTALLDLLEQLDPVQAVEVGKVLLNTSENADEWALSLRTLARHAVSMDDRAFLQSKVQTLLHKDAWLDEPSFSYLHAFDAAVADGQSMTIERLGELMSAPPNRAVGHAAIISLDRFFQQHAFVSANYVVEHPEFLATATGFRASLMARVNPVEQAETATAEMYLAAEEFTVEEKRTFFESYPNFNSTYSYNLITGSLLLSRPEMKKRSLAALRQLESWLDEGSFPEFDGDINNAVNRLTRIWKLDQ
jgi:hypothetical protein